MIIGTTGALHWHERGKSKKVHSHPKISAFLTKHLRQMISGLMKGWFNLLADATDNMGQSGTWGDQSWGSSTTKAQFW
ncbi:hypothetical protein GOZ78_02650 [Agrobacterium vitis]|uniref:Uncharacterized protein n=1 Tax=Agrobacterium vitis TaxID=373 RepID=A0ABD6G6J8_AGRVI|nr:hypothetical protein [Agrobacterium vitis]MUO77796.1 hypothetical protein [Agrobacterium vitis]MUO93314.1 hypothetical protein [Agrobacterium vitis]MUP04665.1 hypothetical protein [Agrobacterium vitis]MUZ80898.1 hypothetical protein [Agrobacterium vitis]MVA08917.1 hypothetical protein [Agrobacterium vitis]